MLLLLLLLSLIILALALHLALALARERFSSHRIVNALYLGLEDNWSQLRLASLLAAKTFLPPRTVGGGQRRLLAAVAVPPELG